MSGLGIGSLKRSIASYGRQSQDRTPENYLTPFQRADLMGRVQTMGEIQRSQAEDAIARRTRDTSGMAYQQQMAKLNEGAAGAVGANVADIEMKDLEMGAQAKQQRLANLARQIQMKQQWTQMKAQQVAQKKAEEAESAAKKEKGKTNWGQIAGTVGGAAIGSMFGPMGAQIGASAGGAIGGSIDGGGQQGSGMDAGGGMMSMLGPLMGGMGGGKAPASSQSTIGTGQQLASLNSKQWGNAQPPMGIDQGMLYGNMFNQMAPGFYGI